MEEWLEHMEEVYLKVMKPDKVDESA